MSKIKDLLKDINTVLVFDVDGVLAKIEYGKYNHYLLDDKKWAMSTASGDVYYKEDSVIKSMQEYINTRKIDNVFTCSKVLNEKEEKLKINFLVKYYNIKKDNIYFVYSNEEKLEVLNKIKENYLNLKDYQIAMIDDNMGVLNHIRDNSNFATIHISSFI